MTSIEVVDWTSLWSSSSRVDSSSRADEFEEPATDCSDVEDAAFDDFSEATEAALEEAFDEVLEGALEEGCDEMTDWVVEWTAGRNYELANIHVNVQNE